MVRINLINPNCLSDQHLIAEYNEILMLLGYVKKHPGMSRIPDNYCLGKGHILFFKDKLVYLQKRHGLIRCEMALRGFAARKKVALGIFSKRLRNDWKPRKKDYPIIIERLSWKIRKKPGFYRYCGEHKNPSFFLSLLEKSINI